MTQTPFAVAAKAFDKPSETFIRLHASDLAPGCTALLAADQTGPDTLLPPMPALWAFRRDARSIWTRLGLRSSAVAAFLKTHAVQTVLAEYGNVGRWLLPHTNRAGVRLFVHFHGYDATQALQTAAQRRKHHALFAQAAGFFAPSEFIKDRLVEAGCAANKITVAPCGVDPDAFTPSIREPGRLLAVGRFVPKKAPLTLLRAFASAARENPTLHLDYVGDGELLEAARTQAQQDGISDRVTFHGAQPHDVVKSLMGRTALFVQHSVTAEDGDTEGLPVAIMEAMAASVPVVSTRHSGIPEAVIDGVTGELVDEHDAEGMAHAILRFAALPRDQMDAIAAAGRTRLETAFTAQRSLEILRSTMGL